MTLGEWNALPSAQAMICSLRCCGSRVWAQAMVTARPMASLEAVLTAAEDAALALNERDWLEAFAAHPRIGDVDSLRAKYADTKAWASGEQAGVAGAQDEVLRGLAQGNAAYEARFGFLFIVCATGKSAADMLALLQARLPNTREAELRRAAEEQLKIAKIRLCKMLETPEQPS